MNYVVPVLIVLSLLFSVFKKVSVYDSFIEGGKEAARLILTLLPYLIAVFVFIEVFEASGLNKYVSKYLGYILHIFGIPNELSELVIIRPLSGSGSLGVLEKILSEYGADSYIGRCASVICGASDTVFYIVAVYLSECKEKKAPFAIPIALFSSFIGVILACFLCRYL